MSGTSRRPCPPFPSAFGRDRRGGVAVLFGLALPVLLTAASATFTYAQLASRRAELQNAADSAALAVTRELTLGNPTDERLVNAATATALAALANGRPEGTTATPEPAVARDDAGQRTGMDLTITETVATPWGRLLSMPTSTLSVTAKARVIGSRKICMIGLDRSMRGTIHLRAQAKVTAPDCGIYANAKDPEGLTAENDATVRAGLICSAGGVKEGRKGVSLLPAALTDCPTMADPLLGRPAPSTAGPCVAVSEVRGQGRPPRLKDSKAVVRQVLSADATIVDAGSGVELQPGVYCDGLTVHGGAKVRLRPGIYVMKGPLVVDDSSLRGENVGFYFAGDGASLLFDEDSSISLTAPKSGEMTGLLFFEERRVVNPVEALVGKIKGKVPAMPPGSPPLREYRIISNDAQNLLGTIYLPSGRLIIDSDKPVASQSAYTVVVARRIELHAGPNLVLNSDYAGTDIPVPAGVGPVGKKSVGLTQ
jgi:Flp pilus assembly protein TadG